MKKMCGTSSQSKVIKCDRREGKEKLYYLPWQDENDTITEKYESIFTHMFIDLMYI